MRWASDNGEQHDQCASLARTPSCLPDSPHLARDLDRPRTYAAPLCAAPVRTESSTTSPQASRAPSESGEQHDQCASLPRTQPCLPRLPAVANTCVLLASKGARVRIHFQQLCAQPGPPAHPRPTSMRWAGESGAGKHMRATCQQRRARSDPLQSTCARPGLPAHPRATRLQLTESSTTTPQASRALNHACPDCPH